MEVLVTDPQSKPTLWFYLLSVTDVTVRSFTIGTQCNAPLTPGWNEHEQAILRAAEELHRDAMISDATWTTLSKYLNDQQLIELPILIGQYQTVAYYQNSLRLRLHEGNLGLKAR